MKKHKVFSNLVEIRKSNRELIMSSVLLAVAVNLLSNGLAEVAGTWVQTLIGVLVCAGVIVWNLYTKLHNISNTINVEGFFVYGNDDHELIDVPNYPIGRDMVRYLQAACTENKAIERKWASGTINTFAAKQKRSVEGEAMAPAYCGDLLEELLEYCVINRLSMHLSGFFKKQPKKSKVAELCDLDVPDVLLKNRFMKLFSEDMDNREVFACVDGPVNKNVKGKVVMATNQSGAIYERFQLILPKGSRVVRKGKNQLLIDTPILSMTIEIVYSGFLTVIKSSFMRFYLGLNNPMDYGPYMFNIKVCVDFKPQILFSKEKESYYTWVDSFMDELEWYVSKDFFFEKINWNTVECLLRSMSGTKQIKKSSPRSESTTVSYTVIEDETEE